MKFQERRGPRGARKTPDHILDPSVAFERALADREAWRAEKAARDGPRPEEPPGRRVDQEGKEESRRRADFAEALARSVFGRFYWKERPQTGRRPKKDK
jgi:hypothetical protein